MEQLLAAPDQWGLRGFSLKAWKKCPCAEAMKSNPLEESGFRMLSSEEGYIAQNLSAYSSITIKSQCPDGVSFEQIGVKLSA